MLSSSVAIQTKEIQQTIPRRATRKCSAEAERWMGMAGMRGATATERSSNIISKASELARTAARNPLANKGTQVCEDRTSNAYDDDLEQGIEGMNRLGDNSM